MSTQAKSLAITHSAEMFVPCSRGSFSRVLPSCLTPRHNIVLDREKALGIKFAWAPWGYALCREVREVT